MGRLEKTDRLDAGIIAWYAEVKGIVGQPPASPAQQQLQALVTRLRQLTAAHTAQKNQRRLVGEPAVLALFDELIAVLKRQMRQIEQAIAGLLDTDPLWQALDQAFREIKGVADRSVARLHGRAARDRHHLQQGHRQARRHRPDRQRHRQTQGTTPCPWRPRRARALLFTIAEIVRRHVPDFADFHQKLSQAGKAKKVIRVALASQTSCPPQRQSPRCPPTTRFRRSTGQTVAHPVVWDCVVGFAFSQFCQPQLTVMLLQLWLTHARTHQERRLGLSHGRGNLQPLRHGRLP